ncbi:MAG TPA: histidinol-phosphate transaminase [Gemmatimonadaceae bacterium]
MSAREAPTERDVVIRAAVANLSPYNVDGPRCEIDLSANTNAFGVAAPVAELVTRATIDQLVGYPSSYSSELREAIAGYVGVAPDEVIVGCGSDDVLDCAFRAFAEPGGCAATIHPTFVMAPIFARTNALEVTRVPLRDDLDADADALLATGASVTYLCSPNNPTGNLLAPPTVERVITASRGVVLVDEAYAEYAGVNLAATAPARDNVLALRTFSKAFGLAGLRVGYGTGAARLIRELEKVRGPYKVTSLGERAALAALGPSALDWMRDVVARTVDLRERFIAALRQAGFHPVPSAANFVLVPVPDAARAAATLRAQGIGVRAFPALTGIGDALRITIGPWPVLQRVVHALPAEHA